MESSVAAPILGLQVWVLLHQILQQRCYAKEGSPVACPLALLRTGWRSTHIQAAHLAAHLQANCQSKAVT